MDRHFREHHRALVSHVRRKGAIADEAEDIVQETWARAAVAAETGAIRNLVAYLYRVAGNLSIDHLRRARVRAHLRLDVAHPEAVEVACPAPIADEILIRAEAEIAFDAAISRLPIRARRILLLSRVEGWTYERISRHLGISERTVSNDLALAIHSCMDSLARHGG